MYKVFTESELQLWRDWITSLVPKTVVDFDIYSSMIDLIKHMAIQQTGQPAHAEVKIVGPDPKDEKNKVSLTIKDWLANPDPTCVLKALMDPENKLIKVGDSANSSWVQSLMSPSNRMGTAFYSVAVDPGPKDAKHPSSIWTWRDVAVRWIDEGCPMKPKTDLKDVKKSEKKKRRVRVHLPH